MGRFQRPAKGMVFLLAGLLAGLGPGCGTEPPAAPPSGAQPAQTAAPEKEAPDGGFKIVLPDRVFTLDDVIAAGWKESKEFPVEALPGARSAWYGFFNRKDIEVRVYDSHQAAIELGEAPALAAAKRAKRRGGGEVGAGHGGITGYNAYLIAGNLVMLCETQVSVCEDLVAQIR